MFDGRRRRRQIGPPETGRRCSGTLAARSMPGVILSQLEIHEGVGAVCVDHGFDSRDGRGWAGE